MLIRITSKQNAEKVESDKALKEREGALVAEREAFEKTQAEVKTETERVAALEKDIKAKTLDAAERVMRAGAVMEEAKLAREKQQAEIVAAVAIAVEEAKRQNSGGAISTSVWVLSAIVAALLATCAHLWMGQRAC
jgi:hypothetical protein